jgi:hypothetical protein
MQQDLSRYDSEEEDDDGHGMRTPEFHVSDGFIREFKKRNGFSSRRAHFKRRPAIDAAREARQMEEIEELLGTVPMDMIYNADETSWRLYPSGITTWAERGNDRITIASSGK